MYLLDTNVVSEIRRASRGLADANVVAWASAVPTHLLHLSVVSVLELELGVLAKARTDSKQGDVLRRWLHGQVLPAFDGRIIPVDVQVALTCAPLHIPGRRPERDALIAATALAHRLTLVTRNTKDFKEIEVQLINPWNPPSN